MRNGKYANRNSKKVTVTLLALVLVLGCAIGGTIAWLTDDAGPVTNTFTVGDINIDLNETTGTQYKIIPGGESAKDPKLTVQSGSEKCYVYAYVENNLALNNSIVVTPDINSTDWIEVAKVTGADGTTKVLYRYKEIVDATSASVELPVFTKVGYADTITKGDINTLNNKTIIVNGFAHQSDNTTQDVADAAAKAHFSMT